MRTWLTSDRDFMFPGGLDLMYVRAEGAWQLKLHVFAVLVISFTSIGAQNKVAHEMAPQCIALEGPCELQPKESITVMMIAQPQPIRCTSPACCPCYLAGPGGSSGWEPLPKGT